MGKEQSKPKKPMSNEKVIAIMEQYPQAVLQYYQTREDEIEKYIVENFWEEDVERWLVAIRKRSPKEILQVRKIDYMRRENTFSHTTSDYEHKNLVIRRAGTFDINVLFGNRAFNAERDDISVVFEIGGNPNEASGSRITCPAGNKTKANKWNCTIVSSDNAAKSLTLRINVPANAIIGKYSISLDIVSGVQQGRENSTFKGSSVIVLFNPFSKDDVVFMEDAQQRNEYVLSDTGFINVGSYGRFGEGIGKRRWDFAQFDEGVLDCVLQMIENDVRMLDKPEKNLKRCRSPVFLSRVLAAMINCNDDNGVLWGRWDGEYGDGEKPTSWVDSASILLEWRENNMAPVRYGQCWVFSGLLTTALRALGIPARSVTNFESAHDTDRNETVDIYIDRESGVKLDETSDSVWNFHVWNEGYFKRKDLPPGYDGWQVVDATPQEESDIVGQGKTLMQCGPAPLKAIKEGEINIGFDTGFVFSEVNADKVLWFVDSDRKITLQPQIRRRAVGKFIGTKAVGKYETENIIDQYKYKEGSDDERKAFNKAYSLGSKEFGADFETDITLMDPSFEIKIQEFKNPLVGDNFTTKIAVKNISKKNQNGTVRVVANSKRHNGKIHSILKEVKFAFDIAVGDTSEFTFQLDHDDYLQNIVDDYTIGLVASVSSAIDGTVAIEELDATLEFPECISVKLPEKIWGDEDSTFDITFTNKLPIKLTAGSFKVRARGSIAKQFKNMKISEPLLPNQTHTIKGVKIHPKFGWKSVYASVIFDCAQLKAFRYDFRIRINM